MKPYTATEERAEIERLARLIARAVHAFDPDHLVMDTEPRRMRGFWDPGESSLHPLWTMYVGAARAVFDDRQRQEEGASVAEDVP